MTFEAFYESLALADLGYILSYLPNGFKTIETYSDVWTFDKTGALVEHETRRRA